MDRSPAISLLVAHAVVLALCGLASGFATVGWAGFWVAAMLDPTAPTGLAWFFAGGLVVRIGLLLATAFATVAAAAAAASLHRGEPRFVVVAAVAALVVPSVNLVMGAITFDPTACLWTAPLLLGALAGLVALVALTGTRRQGGSSWAPEAHRDAGSTRS